MKNILKLLFGILFVCFVCLGLYCASVNEEMRQSREDTTQIRQNLERMRHNNEARGGDWTVEDENGYLYKISFRHSANEDVSAKIKELENRIQKLESNLELLVSVLEKIGDQNKINNNGYKSSLQILSNGYYNVTLTYYAK